MFTLSHAATYLWFSLFLLVATKHSFSLSCETDRKHTCDCNLQPSTRSVFVERNGHFNSSVNDNFVQAIKSLQYCQGSFFCRPHFKINQLLDRVHTNSHLVCFSDENCLSAGHEVSTMLTRGSVGDTCITKKCMDPKEILTFNITNEYSQMGVYKCIKIGPLGILNQFCLRPVCKSFTAIEKLCTCDFLIQNCTCTNYCQNLNTIFSHKTHALFLSFGDIYITAGAKINYLSYFILSMLCIGSMIIVIVFCNFYITLNRLASCNDTQNTETIRRILTATLPSPLPPPEKEIDSSTDRGSPPPTYEQVLKDKCIEFKKTVL